METKKDNKDLDNKDFDAIILDFFWNLIGGVPKEGTFVLVSNGPYQDFHEAVETSKDKDALIKRGTTMASSGYYSSIVIYDHEKEEVWNAGLPSTL